MVSLFRCDYSPDSMGRKNQKGRRISAGRPFNFGPTIKRVKRVPLEAAGPGQRLDAHSARRYFSALRFLEFGLVLHQSGGATQSTRPKFNDHELFVGVILVLELIVPGTREAKPRIIVRIA